MLSDYNENAVYMTKYKEEQAAFPYRGMSDRELIAACQDKGWPSRGYVSWLNWESETYSHGKIFREWARYPRLLPLFFSSDHGVNWSSIFWKNEQESKGIDYLTWNYKKFLNHKNKSKKKVHYVPHPWTFYRRTLRATETPNREGTLVFFPHSTSNSVVRYNSLDGYFNELENLDNKYHPLVLCLSHHDVNKGLHSQLRKYSLPIITLGNATERNFVDNFYNVLNNFKYATSPDYGSQVCFAIEAGVPYFLLGEKPQYFEINELGEQTPFRSQRIIYDSEEISEHEHFLDLLREKKDFIDEEVKKIANKYLGLEKQTSRRHVTWIIWVSLIKNIHRLPKFYFTEIIQSIKFRIS